MLERIEKQKQKNDNKYGPKKGKGVEKQEACSVSELYAASYVQAAWRGFQSREAFAVAEIRDDWMANSLQNNRNLQKAAQIGVYAMPVQLPMR